MPTSPSADELHERLNSFAELLPDPAKTPARVEIGAAAYEWFKAETESLRATTAPYLLSPLEALFGLPIYERPEMFTYAWRVVSANGTVLSEGALSL